MELKATLTKPYTDIQRADFIVENNHRQGYEIRETEIALEAWGKDNNELLEQAKLSKLISLTSSRDAEEYHNVTTDIGVFEFDPLSQTRLTNAMNSMNDMQTREWTTADHTIVTMYKSDFQNIFKVAAVRSDENFAKLNRLKSLVNNATTVAEVEAIKWETVSVND